MIYNICAFFEHKGAPRYKGAEWVRKSKVKNTHLSFESS
jgi:hypothetical protein